jgi:hypothetical protein
LEALRARGSEEENIVYLSSGWDSTSLLASLVHIFGPKKVRAVIGRFNFADRSGINNPFELKRAKDVADYFKVKLDITEIDHNKKGPEILDKWQGYMKSHMFSGMSSILWARLSDFVSTLNKDAAVFSGEISDGVHNMGFSQFTTIFHKDLNFREYSDKMALYLFGPTFFNSMVDGSYKDDVIFKLLEQPYSSDMFDNVGTDTSRCAIQLLTGMFTSTRRFPLWSSKNSQIFTDKGRQLYSETLATEYFNEAAKGMNPKNVYSWYLHLYNSFHWQGGTVLSLPATGEKNGVNITLPFYDAKSQERLASMPEHCGRGLDLRPTKYPLKQYLETMIDYPIHLQVGPHSYLYDVDPSFNHAGEFIYASAYAPIIKERIKERKYRQLLSEEVFDVSYYDGIVDNYLKGLEIPTERTDLSALAFMTLTDWY